MEKFLIKDIKARQILDSRGNPTVEVDVILNDDTMGRFAVPSGASTGINEAWELRDGDKRNYNGKSVEKAVNNVNSIIKPNLIGKDASNQEEIDNFLINLDGTKNKSNLGANAILGVSCAVAVACSKAQKMPLFRYLGSGTILPTPMMNIINGGKHADNNLNIQEFMIVPIGAKTFKQALKMCAEVYQNLKSILKNEGFTTSVGDEGGFAPNFKHDEEAFMYILKAIEKSGYKAGNDISLAVDVAASEMKNEAVKLNKPDMYYFWKTNKLYSLGEMIDFWKEMIAKYPIISIEDPISEEDFNGWKEITKELGDKVQLVGDDLFVTNKELLQKGIDEKCANSILIKLNQIGTLTETIQTINLAKQNGYKTVISHRSGETEDTFIADLSVALNCGQIKSGAPCRTDRLCKYNQLLRIEEEIND